MFSQRNPIWSDIHLGTSSRLTIGSDGCLLTCGAQMLKDCGINTDPARFNRWMARNGGFVGGYLIRFDKMGVPANLSCEVISCMSQPAPVEHIREVVDSGGFVIVHVDFNPTSLYVQQHWVRILEFTDGGDALIHDPWLPDGGPAYLLTRYGLPHWDLARAIFRVALYTHRRQGDVEQRAYVQKI